MGTAMQKAVQAAVSRGVPVGGTSAGCDIQGNYIYTAADDTDDDHGANLESEEALRDPYYYQVTLQEDPFIYHVRDFHNNPQLFCDLLLVLYVSCSVGRLRG
jgi:peptidase E